MSEALIRQEEAGPSDILAVITQVVSNPAMDVEKIERLLAMHERVTKERQRIEFAAALARIQAQMPQIPKNGQIVVKGVERSRYAKLEDIDRAIRPMLDAEGFSLAFDSESGDGALFRLSCTLAHRAGHAETKTIVLPIDRSQFRSDVQSIGSTISYARRTLIKMWLNIVEADEDDDGAGGSDPISEDQARDLQALIDEVKADVARFLAYMGVESLEQIPRRDFQRAVSALESKRRK